MMALAARAAVGPAASRSFTAVSTARVERRLALDDFVHESDPQRARCIESAAAGKEGPGVGLADLGNHERRDDRRQDSQPRLREAELAPASAMTRSLPRTGPSRRRAPRPGRAPPPARRSDRSRRTSLPSPWRPARFPRVVRPSCARIQLTSAPAQNDGPSPARTTHAGCRRARRKRLNSRRSSPISSALNAL